ncbi:testis-expressed protein 9 [Oreochromis niloticus]|uniref:Testis expressed 9 n=1 Tax=Oreochromis niloticus TaxID=8128 RepID=I3JEJ4_ORENI|nr:testis-expressed protein 9 [Oreochromis niloticus]CAI5645588.1 unnamed protein product [Mustela putorius furo]
MAARSVDKKVQPLISQVKKRPSSTSKAERSKRVEIRAQSKSASGQAKKHTDELLAKEEEYKLLNAELEAKTADLVRQAEQLMREQSEVLSNPLSNVLLTDTEEEETSRITKTRTCAVQQPGVKEVTKKSVASRSQNMLSGKQVKDPHFKTESSEDDFEAVEDSANSFLAKTIHSMEEKMNNAVVHENAVDEIPNFGDNVGSGVSEAQIRVLKAKLRIMQEELDQISCEYYKKDDENTKLSAKIKELEEDRARLQKTVSIQQTQIEKHRALAAESNKKCDGLQLEVSGLSKEIENLNRSHKQAAAVHSTVEVRLNRALEEVERLKTQLNKMKQEKKDKITEEHQSRENLLAENKMLKKQKAELIMGFKKQLKLIDILKRQKMHFEAAKLLSFTEEEFMKALDWGKS